MARIRSIKPTIWTDERFVQLSRDARLLCIGMISHADDEGRLFASPTRLAGDVFPGDDLKTGYVRQLRDEVASSGLANIYTIGKIEYAMFPNWKRHQRISKPQKSTLPGPDEVRDDSATVPQPVAERVRRKRVPTPAPVVSLARGGADVTETGDRIPLKRGGTESADEGNAGSVVKAYVDGAIGAGLDRPSERLRGKVGRDAARLLAKEHVPLERLVAAASSMGARGWDDLDRELQRVGASRVGPASPERKWDPVFG